MVAINALRETVERIGNIDLRNELLEKISEIQRNFVEKEGQIEALAMQLKGGHGCAGCVPANTCDYDPPV